MSDTILASFSTIEKAQAAMNDLRSAGFADSEVGLATYKAGEMDLHGDQDDVHGDEGAGFGATVGSVVGAVAGLAAITIPGIGPVIAAGPLAAALGAITGAGVGAVTGAVTGGITASLVDFGVPEEDAHYYAESLRRGGALVSVNVITDAEADRATKILQNHAPLDIDSHVSKWRQSGWKGFDPAGKPLTADEIARERQLYNDEPDYEQAVRTYPRHA